MMRGPKTELILYRYTATKDTGGSVVLTWTAKRKVKGVLTFIGADERESSDKETIKLTHQFWCSFQKGLDITEKDEFSSIGNRHRYRVVYSDNILEMNKNMKIDLIKIR